MHRLINVEMTVRSYAPYPMVSIHVLYGRTIWFVFVLNKHVLIIQFTEVKTKIKMNLILSWKN